MRRTCGMVILAVAATVLGVWFGFPRSPRVQAAPAADPPSSDKQSYQYVGAHSCAAAACHNAGGPSGSTRSEYTTWATLDKHARAYDDLFGERGKRIQWHLDGRKGKLEDARPEANQLCLRCHVDPQVDKMSASFHGDGVSCESCHGPASGYLSEHHKWGGLTREKKQARRKQYGMKDTIDLVGRAEACVTCHVGKGDIEVNHDLIAAGHPRLNFEFGIYLANVPRHWDAQADRKNYPDLEARAWAIGQVVSSHASLRLLEHRAKHAEHKPWPEFAEYDCFACHHNLADQKWRREKSYLGSRPLGSPPWGNWYFSMTDVLAKYPPGKGLTVPEKLIADLREQMQKTLPDSKEVGKLSGQAAQMLENSLPHLGKQPYDRKILDALLDTLDQRVRGEFSSSNWDRAAQHYLTAEAAHAASKGLDQKYRDAEREKFLKEMHESLEFCPCYESPLGFDPKWFGNRAKKAPQ